MLFRRNDQRISIHAPLAGCDVDGRADRREPDISIHAPLAGCDQFRIPAGVLCQISIHAPLAGCDPMLLAIPHRKKISIHAPLAGCDFLGLFQLPLGGDFNPRTPCGVRLYTRCTPRCCYRRISIHAPLAGCDPPLRSKISFQVFQSTHPLRGATMDGESLVQDSVAFQSTHPLRGATRMATA